MTLANRAVRAVAGRDVAAAFSIWGRRRDRYWHRASSGLGSLALAQHLGWPVWQQLAATGLGVTFGGGRWSPDADQGRAFRFIRWLVPDWLERLVGRPFDHHAITHSVTIHVALIVAGATFLPGAWPLWWVPVAWLFHDLGDALIGKRYQGEAGPAWVLWWGNRGLGWFKSGGVVGVLGTIACWVGSGWLLWTQAAT